MCLLGRDSPRTEPARRPAHLEELTDFGGALESAPKGIRTKDCSPLLKVCTSSHEQFCILRNRPDNGWEISGQHTYHRYCDCCYASIQAERRSRAPLRRIHYVRRVKASLNVLPWFLAACAIALVIYTVGCLLRIW
jgi:hypothetical protein